MRASRWCHAGPAPRCPAARFRSPTACCSAWPSSTASGISILTTASSCEPGVTNLAVSNAVAHAGFYYAPDPSSQIACTIGGNVAENSGGVHCLKYGMTTNNVLGCEIVLITGEVLRLGGSISTPRVRSARRDDRLRRTARRGHRSDCPHLEETGDGARALGRLSVVGRRRRMRLAHHRRRDHSGRHGDHGRPGDRGGGAVRPCRLSARCRSVADCRARRASGRSRSSFERVEKIARECRRRACKPRTSEDERLLFWAGRKAAFPLSAGSRRIITAWTAPFRARSSAGAQAHPGVVGEIWSARRQCVSRRRRQSAPADPL